MKRILVTGGFGFLGSHLVEALLQDEFQAVHVVDNLSSSSIPLHVLLQGWEKLSANLSFDLCSVEGFCKCKGSESAFDEIYHLASIVGPAGVLPHAGQIARTILNDACSLADLAVKYGTKLLDVSTSEVYGGGQAGLCSESMEKVVHAAVTVRSEYAVGKLASEVALENLARVKDLDVRIVRPFNIAGPRQSGRGGFVLPRFVAQVLKNKPLTVFGDGSQIRAFCHVRDIVVGLTEAMRIGRRGRIYNLGNLHNKVSISELADLVIELAGVEGSKVFVDPKKIFGPLFTEARDKFPDTRRAIDELRWHPQYTKEEVVQDVLNYMRSADDATFKQLSGGC